MTTKEFFDKYNSVGIDWDKYYGYQCVDLYRQYVHEVLNLPQSPGVEGAKDIWETYLKEHFDRFKNDPDAVPELGDIIVWNKFAGNSYGHVGIYSSGDVNSFTSFDQNWPVGSLCHYQPHNYTNVLGWLRPKKALPPEPDCEFTNQTLIPVGGEWGDVELQTVRSLLNDMKRDLDACEKDKAKLQEDLAKAEEDLAVLEEDNEALLDTIAELDKELAEKELKILDLEASIAQAETVCKIAIDEAVKNSDVLWQSK